MIYAIDFGKIGNKQIMHLLQRIWENAELSNHIESINNKLVINKRQF